MRERARIGVLARPGKAHLVPSRAGGSAGRRAAGRRRSRRGASRARRARGSARRRAPARWWPPRACCRGDVRIAAAEDRHDPPVDRRVPAERDDRLVARACKARMLGDEEDRASTEPWNGVQTATSPSSPSGGAATRHPGAGALAAASAGSPPTAACDRGGRRRAGRDEQVLADQPALAVRDEHPAGRRRGSALEQLPEALRRLHHAAAVRAEPVHDAHAVSGGAEAVAERAQEGPVLVHARQQHDLRQVSRSPAPRLRVRASGGRSSTAVASIATWRRAA